MAQFSPEFSQRLLDFITAHSLYIGLTLSGATEVGGDGYARQPLSVTREGTVLVNAEDIMFPRATGDWGTVRGVGVWDSPDGGMLLFFGAMEGDTGIEGNRRAEFPAGAFRFRLV